jgi:hypothetical protein
MQFFVDPNQTLFDDLSQPLIGRVLFLDYDTSEKKEIYLNDTLVTEAQNPHFTNASSTLENQIFLGYGTYKVQFQRYIGTGVMTDAPDNEFVTYKTLQLDGRASISTPSNEVYIINTIAELRTVDPTAHTVVQVNGYYDITDKIAPRTYVWSSLNTQTDNYGTIIQKTGTNTGRWLMLEPTEMDSRYFGIFPSFTTTYNSQLTALLVWMNSQYAKFKTIKFSYGVYTFVAGTFTFNQKITIEQGTKFALDGSGELVLNIKGDYDIQTTDALVASSSDLSKVTIAFNGDNAFGNKVLSSWYGNWQDSVNGDDASLNGIGLNVGFEYPVEFNSTYYIKSTNVTLFNNIIIDKFDYYVFVLDGGTLEFVDSRFNVIPLNTSSNYISVDAGTYAGVKFTRCFDVPSSMLGSASVSTWLTGIQTNSTDSTFLFDCDLVFNATYTDNGAFKFSFKNGTWTSTAVTNVIIFKSLSGITGYVFSNNMSIGLKDQDLHYRNFVSNTSLATTAELTNAMNSMFVGNGSLDLDGISTSITESVVISVGDDTVGSKNVKNGQFAANYGLTDTFLFNTGCVYLNLENLVFTKGSGYYTKLFNTTFHTIYFLTLKNCYISNAQASSIVFNNYIEDIMIDNCTITSNYILNSNTGRTKQIKVTNSTITADCYEEKTKYLVSNSNIDGYSAGAWYVYHNESRFNDNNFKECDIIVRSKSSLVSGMITDNKFTSTDAKWSRVIIESVTANSVVRGLSIVDNTFTGALTAGMIAITSTGSFDGDSNKHFINIARNVAAYNTSNVTIPTTYAKIYIPQTQGRAASILFTKADIDSYVIKDIPAEVFRLYGVRFDENAFNFSGLIYNVSQGSSNVDIAHYWDLKAVRTDLNCLDSQVAYSLRFHGFDGDYSGYPSTSKCGLALDFKVYTSENSLYY